jgi:hypothetical protein
MKGACPLGQASLASTSILLSPKSIDHHGCNLMEISPILCQVAVQMQ